MVAPLWVNRSNQLCCPKMWAKAHLNFFGGCYSTKPLTLQKFVAIVEKMLEISTIKYLCSPKKWTKVHQFLGVLPPKSPHHAKFHRDRSNQLEEKRYKNWASDTEKNLFCHGQKRDYLQHARGTTKNEKTDWTSLQTTTFLLQL